MEQKQGRKNLKAATMRNKCTYRQMTKDNTFGIFSIRWMDGLIDHCHISEGPEKVKREKKQRDIMKKMLMTVTANGC